MLCWLCKTRFPKSAAGCANNQNNNENVHIPGSKHSYDEKMGRQQLNRKMWHILRKMFALFSIPSFSVLSDICQQDMDGLAAYFYWGPSRPR